ncbi:MAG: hypothetical protein WCF90_04765 [Methanomicrobiales archaeon]
MISLRIVSGTSEGDALGFTEHILSGWLELREENRLCLHNIISREKNVGNTQNPIRQWLAEGYDVSVVMPRTILEHIFWKFRFEQTLEHFPGKYEDRVAVWHCSVMRDAQVSCQQDAVEA